MFLATDEYGRWRFGLSDPSWVGWLTVAVYLATAVLCLRVVRRLAAEPRDLDETRFRRGLLFGWWLGLSALMMAAAANRQLELHILAFDRLRVLALDRGFYAELRAYRIELATVAGALWSACVLLALVWVRRTRPRLVASWMGAVLVSAYIGMRAARVEALDEILQLRLVGFRIARLMEFGGAALVALSAASQGGLVALLLGVGGSDREEVPVEVRIRSTIKSPDSRDQS